MKVPKERDLDGENNAPSEEGANAQCLISIVYIFSTKRAISPVTRPQRSHASSRVITRISTNPSSDLPRDSSCGSPAMSLLRIFLQGYRPVWRPVWRPR